MAITVKKAVLWRREVRSAGVLLTKGGIARMVSAGR